MESVPAGTSRRRMLKQMGLALGAFAGQASIPLSALQSEAVLRWMASVPGTWKPRLLTVAQSELTAAIAETIIPRTDTPGAGEARVHEYIDTVLPETDYSELFVEGLTWMDRYARERLGKPFTEASNDERVSLLEPLGATDEIQLDLLTGIEFFKLIRGLTIFGYYTSREGLVEELGYQGGKVLDRFPAACKHDHHRKEDGAESE